MPYQEREQVDHVFVDAENRVHVLLPVVQWVFLSDIVNSKIS